MVRFPLFLWSNPSFRHALPGAFPGFERLGNRRLLPRLFSRRGAELHLRQFSGLVDRYLFGPFGLWLFRFKHIWAARFGGLFAASFSFYNLHVLWVLCASRAIENKSERKGETRQSASGDG